MKRLAEYIKPYLQLLRLGNLVFLSILLFVMDYWVATPLLQRALFQDLMPWWVLLLLILSVLGIAAGGYVINDYFDVKIDRINRPDDLIVTRVISREAAMRLSFILSAVGLLSGLAVAFWARSWNLLFIYVVVPGLLWFYSASYKRLFLLGNVVVAFVSAIVPLLVAITLSDHLRHLYGAALAYTPIVGELYVWIGGFSLFAFLLTLAREIVKDMEDVEGDREMECRTLPIVLGDAWSRRIVAALVLITMALVTYIGWWVLPFPCEWSTFACRYLLFGLLVPQLCVLLLLRFARSKQELHTLQQVLKFVMFMGVLFSFVIASNLQV